MAKPQVSADPNWDNMRRDGGKAHYNTPETCADLGRERRALIEEALRPERAVVQESPPELPLSVVAAAAFTVRDTTLQQNLAGQNYKY